ncbi:MAG TPA: SMP-30/gluconolactonase/LRE family protein [Chitinophagaceae bacterium]|nr:SMP-30/gluconolactonase/LRE family protein [Chitinophagaceae bacterium]
MKKLMLAVCLLQTIILPAQRPAVQYPVDSASVVHPGVPKGEILTFTFNKSKIFPGTTREVRVYVPAEYNPSTPACVYVNQDGLQWHANIVFDNLIYTKEMPVTIGVFVTPGVVKASNAGALDRYNRSYEYDGLGDNYARFILEEILPEVEKHKTNDGREIHLSKSGNDRAIGGSSSGAICAFNAAWERPGEFSRVFSCIGTYVGLRGADRFKEFLRRYEPKPIRVFLQDGSNDLNIYAGDWWMTNQTMERALTFAGYEVNHVWGEEGHNGNQGTAIFPEAMRWLWKGWPEPVKKGESKNQFLSDLLIPGEDWELVGENYKFTEGTAVNAKGETFYQDIPPGKTYKVDVNGKLTMLPIDAKGASGTAFGPDGMRYVCAGKTKQVIRYDVNENETVIADSISGNDIIVANNGNIYVTAPEGSQNPSKIYLIKPNGEKSVVDVGLKFANGLALTPDQTQLYITESATHWVWIYDVMPDGTLANKQKYGWLVVPDNEENAWPDGLRCDTAGRVYVATRIGIQVLDQMGRVNAILPVPGKQASNVCFGGPNFDELYVTCVDKVFRRKLKTKGVNQFESPLKPMPPHL